MAKTKEELNKLREEFESFNSKLKELTDDELKMITGGATGFGIVYNCVGFCEQNPNTCSSKKTMGFCPKEI